MNPAIIEELFNRIKVWRRAGEQAPHKPLLLLYAIGRYENGAERLLSYKQVDTDLRGLLQRFGPKRKTYHPEYPFWRLQNDGIWEVQDAHQFEIRESNSDAKRRSLLEQNARGGLIQSLFEALRSDPSLRKRVIEDLLQSHFEPIAHEDIRQAVGISKVPPS